MTVAWVFPGQGSQKVGMGSDLAASTAGRYGALVELLNRHAQIAALAVSGGR